MPAPQGTPILASAGGRVASPATAAPTETPSRSTTATVWSTRYAHAAKVLVRTGQVVLPKQPIATVGSTGRSTGPHLHFEVIRQGMPVEPRQYLSHVLGRGSER